ncbi:MAG: cache domain-containing protein [Pseudomonadota bacterium]|nr:cache domain-containing protein [Pseudomonadota bacterium]
MFTSDQSSHYPRIFHALVVSAAVAFLLAIVVLLLPFQKKMSEVEVQAQGEVAHHAALSMQLAVSTLVEREWDSLGGFASFVDVNDYDATRVLTDAAELVSDGVQWAAVADLSGTVFAAAAGMREGMDVSDQAWFRQGLRGPRVNTVNADTLEQNGLVHMSRPVRNDADQVVGVAVYALRTDWIEAFVDETADRLDVDVSMLDASGATIFAHGERVAAPLDASLRTRAELGTRFESHVSPESASGYVAGLLPNVIEGHMPDFGWTLVVRLPLSSADSAVASTMSSLIWAAVGLFAAIGSLALIFALRYLKPISDLVRNAADIADGNVVYPHEAHSSHEAHVLSNALARLQIRMQMAEKTERPRPDLKHAA